MIAKFVVGVFCRGDFFCWREAADGAGFHTINGTWTDAIEVATRYTLREAREILSTQSNQFPQLSAFIAVV